MVLLKRGLVSRVAIYGGISLKQGDDKDHQESNEEIAKNVAEGRTREVSQV